MACHPEQREGPVQFAGSEVTPAGCIGPSRKKRAQDDTRLK